MTNKNEIQATNKFLYPPKYLIIEEGDNSNDK